MSSDIYPFSNLKASFIIFYVNWNMVTVALDCDLLTTFQNVQSLLNFAHDSSMDKQHAVKVLQQYAS